MQEEELACLRALKMNLCTAQHRFYRCHIISHYTHEDLKLLVGRNYFHQQVQILCKFAISFVLFLGTHLFQIFGNPQMATLTHQYLFRYMSYDLNKQPTVNIDFPISGTLAIHIGLAYRIYRRTSKNLKDYLKLLKQSI